MQRSSSSASPLVRLMFLETISATDLSMLSHDHILSLLDFAIDEFNAGCDLFGLASLQPIEADNIMDFDAVDAGTTKKRAAGLKPLDEPLDSLPSLILNPDKKQKCSHALGDDTIERSPLPEDDPEEVEKMPVYPILGDAKVDDAKVDDAKVDDAKLDDAKVDDAKVDDAKVDDAKVDDAKLDDAKVDEPEVMYINTPFPYKLTYGGVELRYVPDRDDMYCHEKMQSPVSPRPSASIGRSGSADEDESGGPVFPSSQYKSAFTRTGSVSIAPYDDAEPAAYSNSVDVEPAAAVRTYSNSVDMEPAVN